MVKVSQRDSWPLRKINAPFNPGAIPIGDAEFACEGAPDDSFDIVDVRNLPDGFD
jgi:hypothetical protein